MNIQELLHALRTLVQWLEWERESTRDFHRYAHKFGGEPGDDVFAFVLKDALRYRGITLEQWRKDREVSE